MPKALTIKQIEGKPGKVYYPFVSHKPSCLIYFSNPV